MTLQKLLPNKPSSITTSRTCSRKSAGRLSSACPTLTPSTRLLSTTTPLEKHKAHKKGEKEHPNDDEVNSLPPIHQLRLGCEAKPLRNVFKKTLAKHKQTKRIEFHGEWHKWEENGQQIINIFSKLISSYNHMNTNSNKDKPPKKDIFLSKREKLEEIEAVYKESIKNLHH